MGETGNNQTPAGYVARRRFLFGAAGAGFAALTIPTIVSVAPASAAGLTSPPPEVEPTVEPRTPTQNTPVDPAQVSAARGQLPFTGADVQTSIAAGLTAMAGGSALMYWSAHQPIAPDLTTEPAVDPAPPGVSPDD